MEKSYDVLATISPRGVVEPGNTVFRWRYPRITKYYELALVRLLIVNMAGHTGTYAIDLWSSEFSPDPPYARPRFIPDKHGFVSYEHALAWCVFNIHDLSPYETDYLKVC